MSLLTRKIPFVLNKTIIPLEDYAEFKKSDIYQGEDELDWLVKHFKKRGYRYLAYNSTGNMEEWGWWNEQVPFAMMANILGNIDLETPKVLLCKWTCDNNPTRIYRDYLLSRRLSYKETEEYYPDPSSFPECELYSVLVYDKEYDGEDEDIICFSGSLPHFLKNPPPYGFKRRKEGTNEGIYERDGLRINRAWENFMDQVKKLMDTSNSHWYQYRRLRNKSFGGKELLISNSHYY